jgi:hypothetical protein
MDRRSFLVRLAQLSAAGLAAPWFVTVPASARSTPVAETGVAARAFGATFALSNSGDILVSQAEGAPWETSVSFGPDCPVTRLVNDREVLWAQVSSEAGPFWLKSTDGKCWCTAQYVRPVSDREATYG